MNMSTTSTVPTPTCSVPGCSRDAEYNVYFTDFKRGYAERFLEEDFTCPYICHEHACENERGHTGGFQDDYSGVRYPYTKQEDGTGYTRYKRLSTGRFLRIDPALRIYPALRSNKRHKTKEAPPRKM
jgi:hypothetical protein